MYTVVIQTICQTEIKSQQPADIKTLTTISLSCFDNLN